MDMEELRLVYEAGMRAFPPRKPEQPIFYPVLNLEYANEIAEQWNTQSGTASGYVAKFSVEDMYSTQFEHHRVGAAHHVELWIPSEVLSCFNEHISAPITVVSAYFGEKFRGYVPSQFGLCGKDATAQFVSLARTLDYSGMDFVCEIGANHLAVFLNYAFWMKSAFSNQGIAKAEQDRVLAAIRRVWIDTFPRVQLPLTSET